MGARGGGLQSGDKLRIATARVMLGDGTALTAQGVAPDITVDVSSADEKAYYADAFKVLTKPEVASTSASGPGTNSARGSANLASSSTATNRTARRPRFN